MEFIKVAHHDGKAHGSKEVVTLRASCVEAFYAVEQGTVLICYSGLHYRTSMRESEVKAMVSRSDRT